MSADEQAGSSTASKLIKPWLVAVWPGMGNVALSAGYYDLKQELDRLEIFKDHEVRFLDLFKKPS